MVTMKDGTEVDDPRLGRLQQWDSRSRAWPIRAVVAPEPRSYTWRFVRSVLNQGPIGACVSYTMGHQALAWPGPLATDLVPRLSTPYLLDAYCAAQQIDSWPGTDASGVCGSRTQSPAYGGTSVLAGLKTYQARGFFRSYRWAFGVEDAVLGIGRNGPALLGTWWYSSMFDPDSSGRITVSGTRSGGHAYVVRAVNVTGKHWLDGEALILNSWGQSYGINGHARIAIRDLARLLDERGECAFAQQRTWRPKGLA